MNTLTIEPPAGGWANPAKTKDSDKQTTAQDEKKSAKAETAAADETLIPLEKPEFTPATKLKPWRKGDALYTAGRNKDKVKSILDDAGAEAANIPPSGLLQVARLYAQSGDMQRAARYYYAAQLRARFDYLRWPLKGADTPYMRLTRDVQEGDLRKIGRWATSSSQRLDAVLDDVRMWDMATAYSYHPGFRIPLGAHIPKEENWPDLLTAARDAFFSDGGNIAQALRSMGR